MAAKKTTAKKRTGPGPKRKRVLAKKIAAERAANPPPKERDLTGSQTRYLRGLGHHLDPVVQVGKDGITDGLVAATKEALLAHELVKVKVQQEAPLDRKDVGPELAKLAAASFVQVLGRTVLLYKRHPNKPKIALPPKE
ncbi:MAG: ribosome assembly RNA-binding protein YhbY [Labilithrix sp.]|nr:ribosome assembly RNA-binding protein YhbY [Labilithrix sp.]MCW5814505.1 ribosome assembly RNA-binding protein YhbY [Labilithrix sp.]